MKTLSLLTLGLSSLIFTGLSFADTYSAMKSVTFKIINNSSHKVDLDTDGGVNGACKTEKDLTTCTTDSEGKLSVGGHLAIDRSFKQPSGIFGALISIINPADNDKNFSIQKIEFSPISASLSTEKWSNNKEEVLITVTDASKANPAIKSAS